jgi:hypothetical protein
MAQVLSGTWDTIKSHEAEFVGRRLLVIIDPEQDDDTTDGALLPSFTVRSREHLVELLSHGLEAGDGVEATPEFWDLKEAELLRRHSERMAQK